MLAWSLSKGLTELKWLFLNSPLVTDAGLVHLKELTELKTLYLNNTNVTDTGLLHLKGLTTLTALALNDTQVTDTGLVHLKDLTKLDSLYLSGTQVTDAGLVHLKDLTELDWLNLHDTQVTDTGLVQLKGLKKTQNAVARQNSCHRQRSLGLTDGAAVPSNRTRSMTSSRQPNGCAHSERPWAEIGCPCGAFFLTAVAAIEPSPSLKEP